MRKALILLTALAAMTACGGGEEAAPTAASTSSAAELPAAGDDTDVTEDLRASAAGQAWAEAITVAVQTQPDRVEVETSIVDPRGDAGSAEAQQAIGVCEGAVAWLQSKGAAEPHVSVLEADGTTFVLYGHPSYPGGCSEV